MPGLLGFACKNSINKDDWHKMLNSLFYTDSLSKTPTLEDERLVIGEVIPHYFDLSNTYFTLEGVTIWVYGEIFNLEECNKIIGTDSITLPELLIAAYNQNKLDVILRKIDGVFCGTIYDAVSKKLYLLTDRNGLKLLYYYFLDGYFIWCSEIKGIVSLNFVNKDIDSSSIKCFLEVGHLLGESTLFKNIKLTEPASIYEFDIVNGTLNQKYYWTWNVIQNNEKIAIDDAIEEIDFLFAKAIKKRVANNEKIGVSLSGGLDSRYIVSTMHKLFPEKRFTAYTFGNKGCLDEKIAKEVAIKAIWDHTSLNFENINWFDIRKNEILRTDGMVDMQHMHGSEFLNQISSLINTNIHGYLGDVVLGGSYIKSVNLCDQYPSEEIAKLFYGSHYFLSNFDSTYCKIKHIDPFLFINRARRMINMGLYSSQNYVNQRMPFFDNDLLEFIYSMSDELRYANSLYSKLLLKNHPDFFGSIPWQKTGMPLGRKVTFYDRLSYLIKRVPIKFGIIKDLNLYFDYNKTDIFDQIKEIRDVIGIKIDNRDIDFSYRYFTLTYYLNSIYETNKIL